MAYPSSEEALRAVAELRERIEDARRELGIAAQGQAPAAGRLRTRLVRRRKHRASQEPVA